MAGENFSKSIEANAENRQGFFGNTCRVEKRVLRRADAKFFRMQCLTIPSRQGIDAVGPRVNTLAAFSFYGVSSIRTGELSCNLRSQSFRRSLAHVTSRPGSPHRSGPIRP